MNRFLSALALCLCFATNALAAEARIIAILPFDVRQASAKMDESSRAFLEESLRDAAIKLLSAAEWTVLSGETTLQVLADNGVDAGKCGDQNCHLSMAREIKAEKFISGSVQFVDGRLSAFVRMIDAKSGKIVASERLMGANVTALQEQFEGKATTFFGVLLPAATDSPKPAEAQKDATPTKAPTPRPVAGKIQGKGWLGAFLKDEPLTLKQREVVSQSKAPTLVGFVPGFAAEEAGLAPKDIIVSIDSEPVTDSVAAFKVFEKKGAGADVSVGFLREGRLTTKTVRLTLPIEEMVTTGKEKVTKQIEDLLGVRLIEARPEVLKRYKIKDRGLLIVANVLEPTLQATNYNGLSVGELFLGIDGKEATSLEAVLQVILDKHPNDSIRLEIAGPGGTRSEWGRVKEP